MISNEKSKELVEQIQSAHRIAVAFSRRILPVFDAIAEAFNCEFAYWEPIETQRPCRGTSQPSQYWAWDFVPLFASTHQYAREKGGKASPQDLAFEFDLYLDENFKKSKRKELGLSSSQQPGGISLKTGRAIVEVYISRPKEVGKQSFDKLWNKCDNAPIGTQTFIDVGHGMEGAAIEVLLEDIIADHQVVIDKISKILGEPLEGKGKSAQSNARMN